MFTFVANFWREIDIRTKHWSFNLNWPCQHWQLVWFLLAECTINGPTARLFVFPADRLSLIVSASVRAQLVDECVYVGIYCAQFNHRQLMHFLLVIRRRINKLLGWRERESERESLREGGERVREGETFTIGSKCSCLLLFLFQHFFLTFFIFLSRTQNLPLGCVCVMILA